MSTSADILKGMAYGFSMPKANERHPKGTLQLIKALCMANAIVGAIQAVRSANTDPELKKIVTRQAVAGKELPTFAGDPED